MSGFATHGPGFLLYLISICCPAWLFRYSHTYLFQGKDLFINSKTNEGYEIRFVTISDVAKLKNFRTSMAKAKDRLNRGDICVVVVRNADDSVVASLWAATDVLYSEFTGTILNTGDDGFYLYSVYTIEEEQSKGLYSGMLLYLITYYYVFNRLFIYAKVDFFNILSIQIKKKIGFKIIGESFAFRLFKFNLCYYKYWNIKLNSNYLFYTNGYAKNLKLV